ncbi:MAG: type IV pilus twitching motility protein PilT [Planctomycetaceae bacterium]
MKRDLGREMTSANESSSEPLRAVVAPGSAGSRAAFRKLLEQMVAMQASDLHVKAGSPPGLRIDGRIVPVAAPPLALEEVVAMVKELLDAEQFEAFLRDGDYDFGYSVPGLARFRVNLLRQRGTLGVVIRRIRHDVPTFEELQLPRVCITLAERPRGLVLVTGPTGSGKSTTLAAMINHINETRPGHIVTMEDPIEFLHQDKMCFITQREIGNDTKSFESALKRALRQDPDVLMVGEMRDLETVSLAVTAAETGHLVFATLHTTGAVQTVDRIVDVFPPAQQGQIRMQLAGALQGVVSQTLLPRIGAGRVLAMEVLIASEAVRALIREGKTPQLSNIMQTSARQGMVTLETSLNDLVQRRVISYETAIAKANFPAQIAPLVGRAPASPAGGAATPPPVQRRQAAAGSRATG